MFYLNKKIIVCRKWTERTESVGTHSIMCEDPNKLKNINSQLQSRLGCGLLAEIQLPDQENKINIIKENCTMPFH